MRLKFLRQNSSRKKLKQKWRKPSGIHSKLRLNKAGHRKKPSPGFRSPKKERASNVSLINSIYGLTNAKQSILLSSNLGLKKRLEILKRARELNLNILNIKNPDEFIKKANESLEKRKQEKKKKETEKRKSKEKSVKQAEKKKQDEKKGGQEKEVEKFKPEVAPIVKERQIDVPQKQPQQISRPTAPKQK